VKDGLGVPQTLLVLGGGSDIGLATARAFVADGTRTVILAGRKPEALEGAAEDLRRRGATKVDLVSFDADDLEAHAAFVDVIFGRPEDIDVVLLAVGVLGDQAWAERDPDAATALLRTNLVGPISVLTSVAERLRGQGHGAIVVLSSVAGERARRSNYVYGASKAGLDAFCQGLGDRLVGTGVHVLVVRPGFVRSKMTAGRRATPFGTRPDAVAAAIVRGLRRDAEIVWVPPTLRWVMVVLRHLPRPLFRRLGGL
jgi:decaprenylphospho-beta-D-erythro-pentofuranosid-2-ulose 2-reductase